jgi:hypothetical protein
MENGHNHSTMKQPQTSQPETIACFKQLSQPVQMEPAILRTMPSKTTIPRPVRLYCNVIFLYNLEELDGPAVVRSRKLSNVLNGHRMSDQNLLSRTPPCFGRHVKPLVPVAFAVISPLQFQRGWTSGRRPVVKIIAESLSHIMKNMLYRPHLVG